MRLSASTSCIPERDPFECLTRLKKAGFEYADICLWNYCRWGLMGEGWKGFIEKLRAHADAIGITIRQTHCNTLGGMEWDDPAYPDRPGYEQSLLRCTEASKLLGAEWMVVHPANLPHDPYFSREKAREANLRYLAPIIDRAKREGIGIAIENLVDFGNCRRRYCGGDPEELIDLVETINDPAVGICIDTGHANLASVHAGAFIRAAGKRLKATHINDNNRVDGDTHLLPYGGTVDWEDAVKALREIGYQNDFSFELAKPKLPADVADSWCRLLFDLGTSLLK